MPVGSTSGCHVMNTIMRIRIAVAISWTINSLIMHTNMSLLADASPRKKTKFREMWDIQRLEWIVDQKVWKKSEISHAQISQIRLSTLTMALLQGEHNHESHLDWDFICLSGTFMCSGKTRRVSIPFRKLHNIIHLGRFPSHYWNGGFFFLNMEQYWYTHMYCMFSAYSSLYERTPDIISKLLHV